MGFIIEGLSPSPGRDRHRGIFPNRLLGALNTEDFAVSINLYSGPGLGTATASVSLLCYSLPFL